MDQARRLRRNCSTYSLRIISRSHSLCSAKWSLSILRFSRGLPGKATKSRITVGRTQISRRCRRKVFAVSYSGPTMKLKAPLGNVPLYFGRRMDQLPNAKNDGSTTNSDMTSFFGTLIRSTGNDRARR